MKSTKTLAVIFILLCMINCNTEKEFDIGDNNLTIEDIAEQYNLKQAEQTVSPDSLLPLSLKEMKEVLELLQNIGKNGEGKVIEISENLSRGRIWDMGANPYPSYGMYRKGIIEDILPIMSYPFPYFLSDLCIEFQFGFAVGPPRILNSYQLSPTGVSDSHVIRYTHNIGLITKGNDDSYFEFIVQGLVLLNYKNGIENQTYTTSVMFTGVYQSGSIWQKELGEFHWYVP